MTPPRCCICKDCMRMRLPASFKPAEFPFVLTTYARKRESSMKSFGGGGTSLWSNIGFGNTVPSNNLGGTFVVPNRYRAQTTLFSLIFSSRIIGDSICFGQQSPSKVFKGSTSPHAPSASAAGIFSAHFSRISSSSIFDATLAIFNMHLEIESCSCAYTSSMLIVFRFASSGVNVQSKFRVSVSKRSASIHGNSATACHAKRLPFMSKSKCFG